MNTWEYLSVPVKAHVRTLGAMPKVEDTANEVQATLARHGREGWELCGVLPLAGGTGGVVTGAVFCFKRPAGG